MKIKKTLLLAVLLLISLSSLLLGQEVTVEVEYNMEKVKDFKGKIGITKYIELKIGKSLFIMNPVAGDYGFWDIDWLFDNKDREYYGGFYFYQQDTSGVGWVLSTVFNIETKVQISPIKDDTNDPREYVITSSLNGAIHQVNNKEPDCNSEFTLIEAAQSPTLLTGVAKTLAHVKYLKPCRKGKWQISLEHEVSQDVLIAFIFAAVQSQNVRHMEEITTSK